MFTSSPVVLHEIYSNCDATHPPSNVNSNHIPWKCGHVARPSCSFWICRRNKTNRERELNRIKKSIWKKSTQRSHIKDHQWWSTYIKVYHNSGLRGKELQDQVPAVWLKWEEIPLVNVMSASSDRNECKSLSFEATKALEPDPQLLCLSCHICKRDASENSNKNFDSQVLLMWGK